MTINVLVCEGDGTQRVVEREVPDDYFPTSPAEQEESANG